MTRNVNLNPVVKQAMDENQLLQTAAIEVILSTLVQVFIMYNLSLSPQHFFNNKIESVTIE